LVGVVTKPARRRAGFQRRSGKIANGETSVPVLPVERIKPPRSPRRIGHEIAAVERDDALVGEHIRGNRSASDTSTCRPGSGLVPSVDSLVGQQLDVGDVVGAQDQLAAGGVWRTLRRTRPATAERGRAVAGRRAG